MRSKLFHEKLRQLIHLIDESGPFEGFASGAYLEILPIGNPFPTSAIWWASLAKTTKIIEETVTYNNNMTINIQTYKVYDIDGVTILATVTDTHSYDGIIETGRVRTIAY